MRLQKSKRRTRTKARTRTVAAALLAATVTGGALVAAAGPVAAAPPKPGAPTTAGEQAAMCRLAYDIMEWAKTKRQRPGDFYDRLANAAFTYIDTNCENVDYLQATRPPTSLSAQAAAVVDRFDVTGVLEIEPMDDPVFPFFSATSPVLAR